MAIAHRGGVEDAPANTLEAFGAAIAAGCRVLETDAHVTRDGRVVAFHDARLDATTDATGALGALSFAEVAAAEAGHRFSPDGGRTFPFRGRGARIPAIEDILLRWPGARVNIDPKSAACVEPLAALVERLGAWDRVCFGSFSDRRLRRLRLLGRGRACTSMGPRAVAVARAAAGTGRMPRQGADCVQVPRRAGPVALVTPRFVRAAHRAGLPVHVWTVNDEPTMRHLLDLGVDGIVTDRPRLLCGVLAERAGADRAAG